MLECAYRKNCFHSSLLRITTRPETFFQQLFQSIQAFRLQKQRQINLAVSAFLLDRSYAYGCRQTLDTLQRLLNQFVRPLGFSTFHKVPPHVFFRLQQAPLRLYPFLSPSYRWNRHAKAVSYIYPFLLIILKSAILISLCCFRFKSASARKQLFLSRRYFKAIEIQVLFRLDFPHLDRFCISDNRDVFRQIESP